MIDSGPPVSAGALVATIAVGCLVLWVVSKSPFTAALLSVLALAAWGLASVGAVLFVVLAIYLPAGALGAAIATVLVGAFLYVPWFIWGLPALLKQGKVLSKPPRFWVG